MICSGRFFQDGHPTVIIAFDTNDKCLVVNITEYNEARSFRFDNTCVLESGSHEYITKKSMVSYQDSKLIKTSELENDLLKGYLRYSKNIVSTEVMTQINQGFKKANDSKILSKEVVKFIRNTIPDLLG